MLNPEKLRPLNGQVVVVDDPKEERQGAIYIPETVGEAKLIRGTILAESCFLLENGEYMATGLNVGDKVVYSTHAGAGNTHEKDKKLYRLIRWNEVLAVERK